MASYAGVETGGTKFVMAFGTGPEDLTTPIAFPTRGPDAALGRVVEEIRQAGNIDAVGIASFGPVDLRPAAPTYGNVLTTPKPGWSGAPVVEVIDRALGLPVGFDTDVNGAALGEQRWGAARGLQSFIYLTVGTGVGGGGVINGRPMHGFNHPEMGHMRIPRHPDDDFPGGCPFHGGCLEGLAAGVAIEARWGRRGEDLGSQTGPAVELEAWYLGTALANLCLTLSPQRIILGGGVVKLPSLVEGVRHRFLECLNGYVTIPEVLDVDTYIVPPALGNRAGVLGAIALAERAHSGIS